VAKSRARVIDEDVIGVVLHILDGWKGKLTWDALIAAIKASMSTEYTRQALAGHKRIADAFVVRKGTLAKEGGRAPTKDARVNALNETVLRLKAENKRLEAEVNNYREMFIRWTSNAQRKGLTSELLNAPLTRVHRAQTKE
jgi:hypothetical protein